MNDFKVIAFTHKNLSLELIGKLHLSEEKRDEILNALKINFSLDELLVLDTCNRVELLITTAKKIDTLLIEDFVFFLNERLTEDEANLLTTNAEIYVGKDGVEHVLKVASSLESMIVGEREIISQVRKAYDFCNQQGLTGDFLRLLIKHTIETAKEIYTSTGISKNPVSVASLAYRKLRDMGIKDNARIVFVGSGQTNTIMAGYFQKHKFANFAVFNRSLHNGKKLAEILNAEAYELNAIKDYKKGFDVLVVCTASSEPVITQQIFSALLNNETPKKIIIDLGVPANVEDSISKKEQVHYIDINSLKAQSEINLQLRRNEILKSEEIILAKTRKFYTLFRERQVELAFGDVPKRVKAIKDLALNEVFVKEVNNLDPQSRDLLNKVLLYVEKKYNAVAIKTAKEVFTKV